jgi:hypothetical protein
MEIIQIMEEGSSRRPQPGRRKSSKGQRRKTTSRGILPWWEKVLYLLVATIVATVWWNRVDVQQTAVSLPSATAASQEQKVAALTSTRVEEPPPSPSGLPREWTVLFKLPTPGQLEVARRSRIQILFNRPVEPEVAESAFKIFPATPGSFTWPRSDHLVFLPQGALLPHTEYTVSLVSVDGSGGARWSFTTGEAKTYRKDIQPLIDAHCSTCHAPNESAAGVPLETYRDVSRHVMPGRSGESRLYTFLQDRRHQVDMTGPAHSASDTAAVIKDWIDEDQGTE